VTTRLRFLGAKRRAERVDLAESGGGRFTVELSGLREVGVPFLEILSREQAAPLADRGRQDRRIQSQEAPIVEEVVDRLLDLAANGEDGALPTAAQPEVTVVEQEIDPVLLWLNWVIRRARPEYRKTDHTQLESTRRSRLGAYLAGDVDRSFERQFLESVPDLDRELSLHEHGLHDPGAIADHCKRHLTRRSYMGDPAANGHGLTDVGRKIGDAGRGLGHGDDGLSCCQDEH